MEIKLKKHYQKYFNVVFIAFSIVDNCAINKANKDSVFFKIKELSEEGCLEMEKENPDKNKIDLIISEMNKMMLLTKKEPKLPSYPKGGLAIIGEKKEEFIIRKQN